MRKTKKRSRVAGIIIKGYKLISMYREKQGKIYYTFPGGGMEENESEQDCVKRELFEEFGIIVEPIKKLYTFNSKIQIEHFYLCNWVSGEFGTGKGEEFDEEVIKKRGIHKPTQIKIADIPNLQLLPKKVALQFYKDYNKNGILVRKSVKKLFGRITKLK